MLPETGHLHAQMKRRDPRQGKARWHRHGSCRIWRLLERSTTSLCHGCLTGLVTAHATHEDPRIWCDATKGRADGAPERTDLPGVHRDSHMCRLRRQLSRANADQRSHRGLANSRRSRKLHQKRRSRNRPVGMPQTRGRRCGQRTASYKCRTWEARQTKCARLSRALQTWKCWHEQAPARR